MDRQRHMEKTLMSPDEAEKILVSVRDALSVGSGITLRWVVQHGLGPHDITDAWNQCQRPHLMRGVFFAARIHRGINLLPNCEHPLLELYCPEYRWGAECGAECTRCMAIIRRALPTVSLQDLVDR